MTSIADVFFTAELEDKHLQVDAKKAGDKAGTTMGKSLSASIKKSWKPEELGKGLVQGLGLAGGLGAARLLEVGIGAVTDVISGSIDAASNLNETMTKSDVIFGKNATAVKAWGDTSAEEFGQSKRAALDTASTFAGLFSTVGLALDDGTDKAKALTKLGSDLASFFNTDVAEATQALRSGLSGESEPLRRFNVFLSDAAVQAKATALGMKKVNGTLTEGQKVTARYAIIMDQTTSAQGDFARTSDGLANSQRSLSAEWEDAQAKLGEALLPTITEFVHFIATEGIPRVLEFADAFGGLVDKISKIGSTEPKNAFDEIIRGMSNFPFKEGRGISGFFEDLVQQERDLLFGTVQWSAANNDLGDTLAVVADRADHTNRVINSIGDTLKDVADKGGRAADKHVTAAGRVDRAYRLVSAHLLTDAQKIVSDYYDVLTLQDDLSATNAEINALRKIAAGRKLTREETTNLHQLEATQSQLAQDLAAHGATTSKTFKATMADLLKRLETAHGKERKAILAEIAALKLLAIQASFTSSKIAGIGGLVSPINSSNAPTSTGRAAGGPVRANTPYVVGEHRPELFVPSVSGTVYPTVPSGVAALSTPGGDTFHLSVLAPEPVQRPIDIVRELRIRSGQGYFRRRK